MSDNDIEKKVWKSFVRKGWITNLDVIHKFGLIHGFSDIAYKMKAKGEKIDDVWKKKSNGKRYKIYLYRGVSK